MQWRASCAIYCLIPLGMSVLAGCDTGSARLPVNGKITGESAAGLEGAISFIPAKGSEGQGATCMVKDGAYAFDRTNGPSAGRFQVSIRRTPAKPTSGPVDRRLRQEWDFEAEVQSGEPYTMNFDLDSSR